MIPLYFMRKQAAYSHIT